MNPDGQIFKLMDTENVDEVKEQLELVEIPPEQLSLVENMNIEERQKWYRQTKAATV